MDAVQKLRFTKMHEWVKWDAKAKVATVGITDFAQDQLSDLTYVELPTVGDSFSSAEEVARVESVKAASPVYAAIGGTITDVNKTLIEKPELINTDPYGAGWIYKIQADDESELDGLLSYEEYEALMPDEE